MLKHLVAVGALVASSVALGDTIIDDNGRYYDAPPGYKAVFVPKDTPDTLVAVRAVDLVEPSSAPDCKKFPKDSKCKRQRDEFKGDCQPPGLVLGPDDRPVCKE